MSDTLTTPKTRSAETAARHKRIDKRLGMVPGTSEQLGQLREIERLTAERDAALARAERAEAEAAKWRALVPDVIREVRREIPDDSELTGGRFGVLVNQAAGMRRALDLIAAKWNCAILDGAHAAAPGAGSEAGK